MNSSQLYDIAAVWLACREEEGRFYGYGEIVSGFLANIEFKFGRTINRCLVVEAIEDALSDAGYGGMLGDY